MTKWKRLFNALVEWQNEKQLGNHVLMFINRAMNPVQYTANQELFESRRDELNVALAFCGLTVGDDGRVRRATVAHNLMMRKNEHVVCIRHLPIERFTRMF